MTDRCPCPRCQSDRLGDYYAGLTADEWSALFEKLTELHRDAAIFWGIGHRLFRESHLQPFIHLCHFAIASDAFAHGALKYGRIGDWRNVPLDHHMQAAGRHFDAWLKDHASTDAESGLTHEAHFLARAVMIQEIRRTNGK